MTPRGSGRTARPTLRTERSLQRAGHRLLVGMDEVGRGAVAGPVAVGVVLIDETVRSAPQGVHDSKMLTPTRRVALVPRIRRWAVGCGVGLASAAEIDEIGIMAALRLAGLRALALLPGRPDLVILDGNHDWLTRPDAVGLLAFADAPDGADGSTDRACATPPVTTMIKADMRCSSVAAASVLAKVHRDELMVSLATRHPAYDWEINKGYAAPAHRRAMAEHGLCEHHRRSWSIGDGLGPERPGDVVSAEAARAVAMDVAPGDGDRARVRAT